MKVLASVCAAALVAALQPLSAQHEHPTPANERLGAVDFPTSCAPGVKPTFNRAVALLHSFQFRDAIRGFESVLASDSTCAMAWWGIALSRWGTPMAPSIRPRPVLESGLQAARRASALATRATERERGFINAVAQLYDGFEQRNQQVRVNAYERAMADAARNGDPRDSGAREAMIFHAIAEVQAASPTDKTYANQLRAGATLERLFAQQPDHPGLAHYIIHSYDYPALAERAALAARRYADIAPSAAHALHMPSHTFTRVGMWNESVATNLRSMEAALRDASLAEALHAADYAVYGYLQTRSDSAAHAILLQLPALSARFDPAAVTGAAPGSAGLFALAAIPARYALERRAWREAAALQPRTTAFPYTDALTWFARALGAGRLGDTAGVRVARDSLAAMRARLTSAGEGYWAEQVAIQELAAEAWLHFASGRHADALAKMREAATREDATEKAAVTPGPLAPARELLADMLMELNRPREALGEYQAALTREPNRYWTLSGAARAATAAGDAARAKSYRESLEALTRP